MQGSDNMSVTLNSLSTMNSDDQAEWTIAGEYSALWSSGGAPPDLFGFLRAHPNISSEQRAKLLSVDQARGWANGEPRRVEDYIRGCPDVAHDRTLMLKLLVREFQFQEPQPSVTEFVDRFPDLRTQLLEHLCFRQPEDTSANPVQNMPAQPQSDETAISSLSMIEAVPPQETVCEPSVMTAVRPDPRLAPEATIDHPSVEPAVVAPIENDGVKRLRNCFPFSTLPAALVDELEGHMQERSFAAGEPLIEQGGPGDSLMLIREGTVNVVVTDELGTRHEIDRSGPGDILGEMALLTEAPRTASIVAREPVRAAILSAQTFHDYATRNPVISQVLTQLFVERLGGNRRDVLSGKTLDQYRIVRRLGKGGMAIVYEGSHEQSGLRVALKMLSHRLVYDKPSLAWFQREADIIEGFDHQNIVRMVGRFQAFHSYFIAMEFCDGITLERLVRLNGPLGEEDFRKTFGQLAAALHYAHERDVIHRDIKPVNLMLNFDGLVKLMDFGLAMPLHTGLSEADAERQIVGTPRYMAPEQLKGRELTKAADYFALGCTAYKLLTGESLFVEPDVIKLREIHSRWKVPDFTAHRSDISPEIAELLTGCLQRRPEKRTCDLAKYATWAAPLEVARLL